MGECECLVEVVRRFYWCFIDKIHVIYAGMEMADHKNISVKNL